jgi:hypothetical protein
VRNKRKKIAAPVLPGLQRRRVRQRSLLLRSVFGSFCRHKRNSPAAIERQEHQMNLAYRYVNGVSIAMLYILLSLLNIIYQIDPQGLEIASFLAMTGL